MSRPKPVVNMTRTELVAEVRRLRRIERLARIAPGFMASLNAEDPDVVSTVVTLLQTPPDVVALWIRANLKAIERRFAS